MSNGHFALFHLAMARPDNDGRSRRSNGTGIAVLLIAVVMVAAIAIPFIAT
jgi:hypothetical protein